MRPSRTPRPNFTALLREKFKDAALGAGDARFDAMLSHALECDRAGNDILSTAAFAAKRFREIAETGVTAHVPKSMGEDILHQAAILAIHRQALINLIRITYGQEAVAPYYEAIRDPWRNTT